MPCDLYLLRPSVCLDVEVKEVQRDQSGGRFPSHIDGNMCVLKLAIMWVHGVLRRGGGERTSKQVRVMG